MDNEKQRVEDVLLEDIRYNQTLLLDLVERVTRLEVKYSWVAGVYGILGGFLASIAVYFGFKGG